MMNVLLLNLLSFFAQIDTISRFTVPYFSRNQLKYQRTILKEHALFIILTLTAIQIHTFAHT